MDCPKALCQNKGMDLSELPLFSTSTEPEPVTEPKHLTVSELTAQIKGKLEPSFTDVWVQGEISNFRPAASGHVYFSLKDANATISAAIFGWAKSQKRARFDLKDGMQVLCHGKVTIYGARGSYQITVDQVEPLGAGALQVAFEQLKERLQKEGLFDPKRKRPLPAFPSRIAVVTSPSGAAIKDMLNVLSRRAPHVKVLVIPAVVQGDQAPRELIRGLELANQHGLGDVVVLARGGGSIEDLWCFNDEELARKIRDSKLPVVSAVGHEIDFTISDFVADVRAATPSAAAEILSHHWVEVRARLKDGSERLRLAIGKQLSVKKMLVEQLSARVISPRDRLREQTQRVDEIFMRLERAMRVRLERRRAGIEHMAGKLDALSPLKVLERGYAIVVSGEKVIRSAAQVASGQEMEIRFHDGQKKVRATD